MDKKSEVPKLNSVSEERSTLANAQDIALETQVEPLRQALDGASAELKTMRIAGLRSV